MKWPTHLESKAGTRSDGGKMDSFEERDGMTEDSRTLKIPLAI